MYLAEMELRNFRNYQALRLNFSPRINIFIGKNAQGKTNILEAAAMFGLGRSFRAKKDIEVIKWNQEFSFLRGRFKEDLLIDQIEIGIGQTQKKVKINRLEKKNNDLFGEIPVIVFSPDDLQIIKGAPQFRRDFIDLYLAQIEPNYRYIYYNYLKVLQQRNRFLKERYPDRDELEAWNTQLVEKGIKIISFRASLIEKIKPYIEQTHYEVSGKNERLGLEYLTINGPVGRKTEQQLAEEFLRELKSLRPLELERKITLVGPQRDDLRLTLDTEIELRTFGSQGQQRTAALALKLGLITLITEMRGKAPLLLLDDVMSEFDGDRKRFLLKMLFSATQTFLTSTSRDDFPVEKLETNFFQVEGGEVSLC